MASLKSAIFVIAVCIVGLALINFFRRTYYRQHIRKLRHQLKPSNTPSIFVSVPSYRDPQCVHTIRNLYAKAKYPLKIFVGVCQQNYAIDGDIDKQYSHIFDELTFPDHVRVFKLDPSKAEGPVLARSLIEKHLYQNESFYLNIDSHSTFAINWDYQLLHMWFSTSDPLSIITSYPPNFEQFMRDFSHAEPTFLRFEEFHSSGIPKLIASEFSRPPNQCYPSMCRAAGFAFGPGSQIKYVPHDPYLRYVFVGEEFNMAARLWTFGYNFKSPQKNVIRHMYERNRPTFFEQFENKTNKAHKQRRKLKKQGYRRLRRLFKLESGWKNEPEYERYGFGHMRSLGHYLDFCGINLETQLLLPRSLRGTTDNASEHEILSKFGSFANYKEEGKNKISDK